MIPLAKHNISNTISIGDIEHYYVWSILREYFKTVNTIYVYHLSNR